MTLQNYRVTFGGKDIDYKNNFVDCRRMYPTVKAVVKWLRHVGHRAWWFFEPYAEITWIAENNEDCMEEVRGILRERGVTEWNEFFPGDGQFADWYGLTPEERESGARRYEAISKVAEAFYDDEWIIEDGLGQERHFMRACHVLANQLGINYEEEGRALAKRGMLASMFWELGHEQAVAEYEKMFGERYMGRDDD